MLSFVGGDPAVTKIAAHPALSRDLEREVYGVFGIPIDRVNLAEAAAAVRAAALAGRPYILSTPNLNFLILSRTDQEFRESLLASDLCTADGMPLVWLAKLLGIPIETRICGSDIFDFLKR